MPRKLDSKVVEKNFRKIAVVPIEFFPIPSIGLGPVTNLAGFAVDPDGFYKTRPRRFFKTYLKQ
ncbi:MAG TPA: hypothetical protein DCL41_11185 [Bdellovibrionales bacterium]|nr:hypothetical protein [Bdellovibrionales bacterium]|tara:strand:- start:1695 stop:1886 length:192 start_codon:yes stop_codon:yes gene_type:complete